MAEDGDRHRRIVRRRPRAALLAGGGAATAVVAGLVAYFTVGGAGSAGGGEPGDDETDAAAVAGSPEELREATLAAADWLEEAGTFSFEAQVMITNPHDQAIAFPLLVGPADGDGVVELSARDVFFAGDLSAEDLQFSLVLPVHHRAAVVGEVSLPGNLQQRVTPRAMGVDDDDATGEELVVGDRLWYRSTAFPELLAETPWIAIATPSGRPVSDPFGADLLPQLLRVASSHDEGEGTRDGRVITAQVPDEALPQHNTLGPLRRGTIEVTLAANGRPDKLRLSATADDGMELTVTYTITGIGGPTTVAAPAPADLDPVPWLPEQDIAYFADLATPVGLTTVPDGWRLTNVSVDPTFLDGMHYLGLVYQGPSTERLGISSSPPARGATRFGGFRPEPFTAGEHTGEIEEVQLGFLDDLTEGDVEPPDSAYTVTFEIADMVVHVHAEDVSDKDELARLLAPLGPVDPVAQAHSAR